MNAAYPSTWKARAQRDADAFARESGWPVGLRLREVQVLNVLAAVGRPMTRREIADGIGVPTARNEPRLASVSKRPGYVANLVGLDLLTRLAAMGPRRRGRRGGKGRRVDLFCLGPNALRCLVARLEAAREAETEASVGPGAGQDQGEGGMGGRPDEQA